jgi:hypothetical protein
MTGAVLQEGWNLDEFVTAVGVILFSALLMYVLAYTLLINPLQQNRRQFQFYTGEAQTRRVNRNVPPAAAGTEQATLTDGEGDTISSHPDHFLAEDAESEPDSGTELFDRGDIASMVRELEKQRRQIETLEAVNDQVCAENERLEAKIAAVSQMIAET